MDYQESALKSSVRNSVSSTGCNTCAHKDYCTVGSECSNEGYQYHFPYHKVRELDGSFTYTTLGGGWLL